MSVASIQPQGFHCCLQGCHFSGSTPVTAGELPPRRIALLGSREQISRTSITTSKDIIPTRLQYPDFATLPLCRPAASPASLESSLHSPSLRQLSWLSHTSSAARFYNMSLNNYLQSMFALTTVLLQSHVLTLLL